MPALQSVEGGGKDNIVSPCGEGVLRAIVEGTAMETGEAFYRALVRSVAEALGVRFAFVAVFGSVRTRFRTLAFWCNGEFVDSAEYEIAGSPCEPVLAGEMRHFPDHIQELFPADTGLVSLGARSYLAIPLADRSGEVLGHLAVFDDKPMPALGDDLSVFRIFAARVTAELQRQQAEAQLRDSEARLAGILASAMDAIITIDGNRRITLFNAAAEQVFKCAADWAIGQPIDRFLSPPLRKILDGYLQPADGAPRPAKPMWAPRGLMAVRANGEEFPSEATISPVHAGGSQLLTIILRDVTDREKVERALQRSQQERQLLQEAMEAEYRRQTVVGTSKRIRALLADVDVVAATDATVLITGETGTGKELVAKEMHNRSRRRERVLVKVNCAALPSELVESELFGHEKGAFTGATQQKKGRFELADGGTIFLDEVGELSASAQAKLLRILQEQEFERVGGTRTLRVDARVVAATNRDLEQMVASHAFRADLYYRLNVFPLLIPPLRERKEDIPVLVKYFLGKLARKLGKALESVSEPSVERLMAYHWPGNVRELHNVVERAAILACGPIVEILGLALGGPATVASAPEVGTLDEVQSRHIQSILELTHGVVEGERGAAAILGLNASTLRFRMKKLGIGRT